MTTILNSMLARCQHRNEIMTDDDEGSLATQEEPYPARRVCFDVASAVLAVASDLETTHTIRCSVGMFCELLE